MANQLYEFRMKVLRGEGCDLPESMKGAYVPCYVAAHDFQAAVKKGVAAITGMHYVFKDIEGQVREIPFASWSEYIAKVWPEFGGHFPSQEELPSLVEKGVVFFGPFAGF
jgi:hypothetical protein